MATEIVMIRRSDGAFVPYGEGEMVKAERFKAGRLATFTAVLMRSYPFHKRWFSLAQFAYDIWTETMPRIQHQGQDVEPNFERFRKDLVILAGYYTRTFNIKGELRLEAQSIAFGSMDQEEFEALYSATINAVMSNILARQAARVWTEQQVRDHVEQLLSYDQ